MLDTIRKRQRSLLTLVTVITIVAFAWWYNPGHAGRAAMGQLGKVNGRVVTVQDVRKLERNLQVAGTVGLRELPALLASGRTRDEQAVSFAWNLLILRDEAQRLEIEPSDQQIKEAEMQLPEFQENGQFNPAKYQVFIDKTLKANGLTAADLDEVVSDNLRLQGILELIKGGAKVPDSMFRENYEKAAAKMHFAVVRLAKAEFEKGVQVSDEDIKKFFETHKDQLRSPEQRRVELVSFLLTDEQKKLDPEKKNAALKLLAEQAEAFVQPLLDHPDQFEQAAKTKNLPVRETGLFSTTSPDALLKSDQALLRQSTALTAEMPVSDVVQGEDGFYVLKLKEIDPSNPLTLDEAKGQIIETLKKERTQAAMEAKAEELREKMLADMKSGHSFVEAATAAGYKPEEPAPFSRQDPGENNPLFVTLYINQVDLEPGQISKLLHDRDDGLLVYLAKRDPVDENKFQEDKKKMGPAVSGQFADMMFEEWLKVQQQRAGRPPV
jgi:hypothetical protein